MIPHGSRSVPHPKHSPYVPKDLDSGTDVVYLYDGWRCIEEREWDTSPDQWEARRQYVHGARYIDEVLLFDKDDDSDGVCHESGTDLRYIYCQDANFNVVALTDDAGVIVEKTWYEAYGKATWYYDSDEQTASSVGNPLLFQSRRWCTETGLYYFRNRDYSCTLGRFLQRDPSGSWGGLGLYEGFASVPISLVDALGLMIGDPDTETDLERERRISYLSAGGVYFPPGRPRHYGILAILDAFFSSDKKERLWVMGENNVYTRRVRAWKPVQKALDEAKRDLAADPEKWKREHMTSFDWKPGMSYAHDPHAFHRRKWGPAGTGPTRCAKEYAVSLGSHVPTEALWTSAIGTFDLYVTADYINSERCVAALRVWMFNDMTEESFGGVGNLMHLWGGRNTQWMWWNWKEEHTWDGTEKSGDTESFEVGDYWWR